MYDVSLGAKHILNANSWVRSPAPAADNLGRFSWMQFFIISAALAPASRDQRRQKASAASCFKQTGVLDMVSMQPAEVIPADRKQSTAIENLKPFPIFIQILLATIRALPELPIKTLTNFFKWMLFYFLSRHSENNTVHYRRLLVVFQGSIKLADSSLSY